MPAPMIDDVSPVPLRIGGAHRVMPSFAHTMGDMTYRQWLIGMSLSGLRARSSIDVDSAMMAHYAIKDADAVIKRLSEK